MIQSSLTALKDYILAQNTYLNKGFDNVYMDEKTGTVANADGEVFPNDTLGNYFYLRLPNQSRFDYTVASRISDCANTPNIVSEITLVACILKGSEDKLMSNILNTLSKYNADVRFTTAMYRKEDVVSRELARLSKENILAALSRVKGTVISVSFTMSTNFQLSKCIVDPCNC